MNGWIRRPTGGQRISLGVPVIDHWWQTETGWPVVANPAGIELLPMKPGSPTRPLPGWDVRILTESGSPAAVGEDGAIVMKLPMPPGALLTLWNDDARFLRSYLSTFPGFYLTGDGGHLDGDGYLYVAGRTDDVINVAGNQLSPGAMEDVLAAHPDVADCAVFGVADSMKGQIPRGLVVLHSDVPDDAAYRARLCADLVQLVRDQIGTVTGIRQVDVVDALPKTRSGKILRKTMSSIADGQDPVVPADHRGCLGARRDPRRAESETAARVDPVPCAGDDRMKDGGRHLLRVRQILADHHPPRNHPIDWNARWRITGGQESIFPHNLGAWLILASCWPRRSTTARRLCTGSWPTSPIPSPRRGPP